jgi:hypothetical protein
LGFHLLFLLDVTPGDIGDFFAPVKRVDPDLFERTDLGGLDGKLLPL